MEEQKKPPRKRGERLNTDNLRSRQPLCVHAATKEPKYSIDWRAVEEMGALMMSAVEISRVLGITRQTLSRRCVKDLDMNLQTVLKNARERGKLSIRRKQFQIAEQGDRTLLIWLGKNYLDQTDLPQPSAETDLNLKVEFVGDGSKAITLEGETVKGLPAPIIDRGDEEYVDD